jgi:hypothetical protein
MPTWVRSVAGHGTKRPKLDRHYRQRIWKGNKKRWRIRSGGNVPDKWKRRQEKRHKPKKWQSEPRNKKRSESGKRTRSEFEMDWHLKQRRQQQMFAIFVKKRAKASVALKCFRD